MIDSDDIKKRTQTVFTSTRVNVVWIQSLYLEFGSDLWIWTPDRDDLQNVTGTSLFKDTFVVKFSCRSN